MSKYSKSKKKRSIPHETSAEGLHKYFKPLTEISNQITSSSSNIQPVQIRNIPTNDLSELCLSSINTSSLVNEVSRLSVNDNEIVLRNSFKKTCTKNFSLISSTDSIQSLLPLRSNMSIESSDTPLLDENNSKRFFL